MAPQQAIYVFRERQLWRWWMHWSRLKRIKLLKAWWAAIMPKSVVLAGKYGPYTMSLTHIIDMKTMIRTCCLLFLPFKFLLLLMLSIESIRMQSWTVCLIIWNQPSHQSRVDVKKLQNADGSFAGDQYGETDTRFSYCAISCASLLGKLDQINVPSAISFIMACQVRLLIIPRFIYRTLMVDLEVFRVLNLMLVKYSVVLEH